MRTLVLFLWTTAFFAGCLGAAEDAAFLDGDDDGLDDAWEQQYFGNLTLNGTSDPDQDRCDNLCEQTAGTDPNAPDTDGDGRLDGDEVAAGTDPLVPAWHPDAPGPVDPTSEPVGLMVPNDGPDVPGAWYRVAEVSAISAHRHTGADRYEQEVAVPADGWSRVLMVVHSWPDQEPWDRTLMVGVNGTELWHGTTPRTDFTVTEDVTEYSTLFRHGNITAWSFLESWVCCGIFVDVTFEFWDDLAVPKQPFDHVQPVLTRQGLHGPGSYVWGNVTLDAAPATAILEVFTSGHTADGEFWYQNLENDQDGPPRFTVYLDGTVVGTVIAAPYVYALIGLDGEAGHAVNKAWWTAPGALDVVGVHLGVGEIPAYRLSLPLDVASGLKGDHTFIIVKDTHGGYWPTSMNLLWDAA